MAQRRRLPVVALLAALLGSMLAFTQATTTSPASADTPNIPVTATATPTAGLSSGSVVHVDVNADAPPNAVASQIFAVDARLCAGNAEVNVLADFNITTGGQCISAPLQVGTNHFVSVGVAPPNLHATLDFVVGVGTNTYTTTFGDPVSITCGIGSPCKLVLRLQTPGENHFTSFLLNYGGTTPDAPAAPTATAGNQSATVAWTAPADGGSAITGYTVTSTPEGKTCTTSGALTCTVSGLTNGTPYTFTVKAENAIGFGPESPASNSVTPAAPTADHFHAVSPDRILDSRPAFQVGPFGSPWTAGMTRDVTVTGAHGVPASGVDAVVLNVTVAGGTADSFLTIWDTGGTKPLVSSVNWKAGTSRPNAVTVKVGAGGKISIFNPGGNVDVIIDVNGYYDTNGGDGFTALSPGRIIDSRPAFQVGPFGSPWSAGETRDVTVLGVGGVPATDVDAVVLNVTVTGGTAGSFLTIWDTGGTKPLVSSLNWTPGQTIPNAVTVKVGSGGKISMFNPGGNVDVLVDVAGYFQNGTGKGFFPLSPERILDSRSAFQVGPFSSPWTAGLTRDVTVTGDHGVPASGVDGVLMNATVTNTTAASFLTIWDKGGTKPLVSSLNWLAGGTEPNAVTAKVGTDGKLSVFNPGGNVDVIFDINGYYA